MEKTDASVEHEEHVPDELKKVMDQDTDDVSKETEDTSHEISTTEHQNDDEVVPSATPKPTEESEGVSETSTVMSDSVSPGRANVPINDVKESEKEEEASATLVNDTEIVQKKKREFDHDDEQVAEKTCAIADPPKKRKISESMDAPGIDAKQTESASEA